MEEDRKTIIINEIKYWKKHRMLPEHYCDFLLALYTEGETVPEREEKEAMMSHLFQHLTKIQRFQMLLLFLLLPFSFVVVYFTEFHVYLQLVILILFLSYSVWCGLHYKDRKKFIAHSGLVITLFLILLMTTLLVSHLSNQILSLVIGMGLNFFLWIWLGIRYKLKYLVITGILGALFVVIYRFL